jgi:hypothetical protein
MYRAKVFEVPYHLLHSEFGIAGQHLILLAP